MYAEDGTLSPTGRSMDGTLSSSSGSYEYTLTLENVSEIMIWYMDRPNRKSGTESVGYFTSAWHGSYGEIAPNAVLDGFVGTNVSNDGLFLTLKEPQYDPISNKLTFNVTLLDSTLDNELVDTLIIEDAKITILNNNSEGQTDMWSSVLLARDAHFEPVGTDGKYWFYLNNVHTKLYHLGNAPNRQSYIYSLKPFMQSWQARFGNIPPNASATSYLENGQLRINLLTLTNPNYDEETNRLTYTTTPLHGEIEPSQTLLSLTLFIDSENDQSNLLSSVFGVSYSPFHDSNYGTHVLTRLQQDFSDIQNHFSIIKTYYPSYYGQDIMPTAQGKGLKAVLGVYLKDQWTDAYKQAAIKQAQDYPNDVIGIVVGNENQLKGSPPNPSNYLVSIPQIAGEIKNQFPNLPVGTAQTITFWCGSNPDTCDPNQYNGAPIQLAKSPNIDFLGLNIYPWTGNPVQDGVNDTFNKIELMKKAYSQYGKQVVVTETGWASEGATGCTWQNEKSYLEQYYERWKSDAEKVPTFFYQMFDWPGFQGAENGKHYGFYKFDNTPKDPIIGSFK